MVTCEACGADAFDIDVKCPRCGNPLGSTGPHRLLGTVVLGQYELVDVLGQGGMSVVYKGRHRLTEQEVALKILPPELAAHPQVKGRFLEEARALAQLDHPNIVHLYNFGQENGCFVLAMQFVLGKTWERQILEKGRLDWAPSVRIAVDVLRALEYAHSRGIVHRDMKPSNVLLRADDGTATVMDFGIAKMTTSTRLTATGQTMGTVRYMSPEQVRGHEVDARTDIYSLGVTLYESLVGETPFDGDTHFDIMTKHLGEPPTPPTARGVTLPAAIEGALMRSLAKRVEDRFQTVRDLRRILETVLKEEDIALSETARMSREAIAEARSPSRASARAAREAPPRPVSELAELARELEPASGLEAAVPRRGRPWLWLWLSVVLAGVVAATGVAVLVVTMQRSNAARGTPVVVVDAPVTPAAFEPPDVTWVASADFADRALKVRTSSAWDPADIAAAHGWVRDRFAQHLAQNAPGTRLGALPMTVLIVPQRLFCDPRIYDGTMPKPCETTGSYYRPNEQTLLVADDRGKLELNLAYGIAEAACLHDAAPGVCAARDGFVADVAKMRK